MTTFYRYLRPLVYNFKRRTCEVYPRGGICFRVNAADDSILFVSYSICHDSDVFSKSAARLIADNRYKYLTYTVKAELQPGKTCNSISTAAIAEAMVSCYEKVLLEKTSDLPQRIYIDHDLRLLKEKIEQIQAVNKSAQNLLELDHLAINALNSAKRYSDARKAW